MILLIDNYDSFVFNLARYVRELGEEVVVVRNDAITVEQIRGMRNSERGLAGIILSPGPCTPNEAGVCLDVVKELSGNVPILGVCLGHQAIVAALGGIVEKAPQPMHGRAVEMEHDGSVIFEGVPNPFRAGRYHSLLAEERTLPSDFTVTARTREDRLIMGVTYRDHPTYGVQFHPESILTEGGHRMLRNFLGVCGVDVPEYTAQELIRGEDQGGSEGGSAVGPKLAFW